MTNSNINNSSNEETKDNDAQSNEETKDNNAQSNEETKDNNAQFSEFEINDNDSLYDLDFNNEDKKYLHIDHNLEELNNKNISLLQKKSGLRTHIQEKLIKFYDQQRLLEHKLSEIKRNNTFIILLLLFFSSILTLIEASKELYKYDTYGATLVLSSIITFLSSYSKVMKHQEILEELVKSLEKCLITQSELRKVQENLIFCNDDNVFDEIKTNYLNNVYVSYLNCQMEIFKAVPKNQQKKIIKEIYDVDCKIKSMFNDKIAKLSKIQIEEGKIIDGKINKVSEKFVFLFVEGLKSEPVLDINELKSMGLSEKIKIGEKLLKDISLIQL